MTCGDSESVIPRQYEFVVVGLTVIELDVVDRPLYTASTLAAS